MNASGIAVADDLRRAWAALPPSVRFVVLTIRDESIVLDTTADIHGDLSSDLPALQHILHDTVPAYVLARLDTPSTHFLAITYVPDAASVRDKMLYASSRTALTRSLGAASFPTALFATAKADLTPAAYAAHLQHVAAPPPLSAAERERAVAERADPPRPAALPAAQRVQLRATDDAARALAALADTAESTLLVLSIDPATETVTLVSHAPCAVDAIGATLPPTDPSYAFFVWHQPSCLDTIFIYSCPSTSPIKHRMLFSSAARAVAASGPSPVTKRVETSDPQEVDATFLRVALGRASDGDTIATAPVAAAVNTSTTPTGEKPSFAKPRGPVRKQR